MPVTILICANDRCGAPGVAQALQQEAQNTVRTLRLNADVHAVRCVDLCQRGPHVVLHGARGDVPDSCRAPDGGVAYDAVTPELMRRIVADHAAAGLPVTGALHVPQPGRSNPPGR